MEKMKWSQELISIVIKGVLKSLNLYYTDVFDNETAYNVIRVELDCLNIKLNEFSDLDREIKTLLGLL